MRHRRFPPISFEPGEHPGFSDDEVRALWAALNLGRTAQERPELTFRFGQLFAEVCDEISVREEARMRSEAAP